MCSECGRALDSHTLGELRRCNEAQELRLKLEFGDGSEADERRRLMFKLTKKVQL